MDIEREQRIKATILELRRQGMTPKEIAKKMRCEKWAVERVIREAAVQSQIIIDGANALKDAIADFFKRNVPCQQYTITIVGYAVEMILHAGASSNEEFDELSNKLHDFLNVCHEDVKEFTVQKQRPDLN